MNMPENEKYMDAEGNENLEAMTSEYEGTAGEENCPEDAGDQESEALPSLMEKLKNELAAARADLYNYRQRVERERSKIRKSIAEDKIADFLPVLDNLDRALAVPEEGSAKDVLIGVRMVRRQFLSILENSEVTAIPTEGCPFDPVLHEAVETEFVEAPEQDGLVLRELLCGFRTTERVLRPAQVRVGRLRS